MKKRSLQFFGVGLLAATALTALVLAAGAPAHTDPAPSQTVSAASFTDDLLALINQLRKDHGLPPLTASPVYALLGANHSNDELEHGYYDHDTPGGPTFEQRVGGFLHSEGYVRLVYDENLDAVAGPLTPDDIFHDWLNSTAHREAMLTKDSTMIGIGTAHADVGTGVWDGQVDITAVTAIFGPPQPVFGKSVLVTTVRGVVYIRPPGQTKFQLLRGTQLIRVGTEVDTSRGRVRMTSASDALGHIQTADFYEGRFLVFYVKPPELQPPETVTSLTLSQPLSCSAAANRRTTPRALATEQRKRPKKGTSKRHLWGDGKGKFRTQGAYASATVRGTIWLTTDTCTVTVIQVQKGVVDVFDFRLGRHVLVHAGQSYTARK